MFEVTLLFLFMLLIGACAFFPLSRTMLFPDKSQRQSGAAGDSGSNSELRIPEGLTHKHTFLTHLQSEIESALFPRPTDSTLQRHYDALVRSELENRLAAMPDS